MKSKAKMRQMAEEQIARLEGIETCEAQDVVRKLEDIVDETRSDSSASWIYETYFEYGISEFTDCKRTVTKLVRQSLKTAVLFLALAVSLTACTITDYRTIHIIADGPTYSYLATDHQLYNLKLRKGDNIRLLTNGSRGDTVTVYDGQFGPNTAGHGPAIGKGIVTSEW